MVTHTHYVCQFCWWSMLEKFFGVWPMESHPGCPYNIALFISTPINSFKYSTHNHICFCIYGNIPTCQNRVTHPNFSQTVMLFVPKLVMTVKCHFWVITDENTALIPGTPKIQIWDCSKTDTTGCDQRHTTVSLQSLWLLNISNQRRGSVPSQPQKKHLFIKETYHDQYAKTLINSNTSNKHMSTNKI